MNAGFLRRFRHHAYMVGGICIGVSAHAVDQPYYSAPISMIRGQPFVPCLADSVADQCAIDTGAPFSKVKDEKFKTYPVLRHSRWQGASGSVVTSDVVLIRELAIGNKTFADWPAAIAGAKEPFVPSVGLDVFRDSDVVFDFQRNVVEFHADFGAEGEGGRTLVVTGSVLTIPVQIGGDQVRAGWDTGTSLCVTTLDFIERNPTLFTFQADIQGGDASGSPISAKLYVLKELRLERFTWKDVKVVGLDLESNSVGPPGGPEFALGTNVMDGYRWRFNVNAGRWGVGKD